MTPQKPTIRRRLALVVALSAVVIGAVVGGRGRVSPPVVVGLVGLVWASVQLGAYVGRS